MDRAIAFDLSRLFLGPMSLTPRGIDRVDLSLAQYFFDEPDSPHVGILPTPWGMRVFPADRVRKGIEHLSSLWDKKALPQAEPVFRHLSDRLRGECRYEAGAGSRELTAGAIMARFARHIMASGLSPGKPVRSAVPDNAIYLNIGQIGLAIPLFFRWLGSRPDVCSAFMLHDVIPLEYPEMVEPASVAHHARMVRTAARHADAIITTTEHARETVHKAMAENGRRDVQGFARSLALPRSFTETIDAPEELAGLRYFVVCSTIEPRKNHRLLLDVWERLKTLPGGPPPHLVIVGSRGFQADAILGMIPKRRLDGYVHHLSGLSTPALVRLMLGSTAVLSPSLAEGFGLPVLEADTIGVPVLASDIPSHREIAGACTTLLPADDAAAWAEAICNLSAPSTLRQSQPTPPHATPAAYCQDIESFLNSLQPRKGNSFRAI